MMLELKSSRQRLYKATVYSINGLKHAFLSEWPFRVEVILSIAVLPIIIVFSKNSISCLILIASWLLILIIELLNSALEAVVDRISKEQHALSGKAKDYGSAAVFLSIVNFSVLFVWLMFWQ